MNLSSPKLPAAKPVNAGSARLVVLGAGRPLAGLAHSALRLVDRNRKILDWIMHAFRGVTTDVTFVGGYGAEQIGADHPAVRLVINPDWAETGAARSLMSLSAEPDSDLFACYSDIVFRQEAVDRLAATASDTLAVAVDWPSSSTRRLERSGREIVRVADGNVVGVGAGGAGEVAEFVGIVKLPRAAVAEMHELTAIPSEALRRGHLSALVAELLKRDFTVHAVPVNGLWSDLEDDHALTRFVFGTKAETIERLHGRMRRASVPSQLRFTVEHWKKERPKLIGEIKNIFGSDLLAVRSSSMAEDGFEASNAGRFVTELNVSNSEHELQAAVERVIASYDDGRTGHQVLVQPMVRDVALSGVALTRTGRVGGPYVTVAWSSASATDGVTSGEAKDQRTFVVHRGRGNALSGAPEQLQQLLEAIEEIEYITDNDALDIEFAIDRADRIHILQVRPLVLRHERTAASDGEVAKLLVAAEERFSALAKPPRGQVGRRPAWGIMPDWNPAEMIGTRPGRLAYDLYAHLICDEVWATQRAEYGYRDVRPWPLIRQFAGQDYVDVRASFNSFVPANADEETAAAIVDVYLARLAARPELHDKVEFDVALTCWSFDFEKRLAALAADMKCPRSRLDPFAQGLIEITRRGIDRVDSDLAQSAAFEKRLSAQLATGGVPLDIAYASLELCRRGGTPPFAHLARGAFVATTLLRSAVSVGILEAARVQEFLRSIETVGRRFVVHAAAVRGGRKTMAEFVEEYGHLRPGTYDIESASYGQAADRFLEPVVARAEAEESSAFAWRSDEAERLTSALAEAGITVTIEKLDHFLRSAIRGREHAKFVFTRALSRALEELARWGKSIGIERAGLAHLSLSDVIAVVRGTLPSDAAVLRPRIEAAATTSQLVGMIELPPLLFDVGDLYAFEYPATEPNYITDKAVISSAVFIEGDEQPESLDGRIVVIPRADPGYDWLFSHKIAALVTVFGGANSHMAIRAAEFGLPAAIGIGELRYRLLQEGGLVELNCRERRLRVLEVQ